MGAVMLILGCAINQSQPPHLFSQFYYCHAVLIIVPLTEHQLCAGTAPTLGMCQPVY